MNIQKIIDGIIVREGGYVNHPDDRGGPTNFGITLDTYRKYKSNASVEDLKRMLRIEAFSIYENEYYVRPKINKIHDISTLVAEEVLDTGVNMGTGIAVRFLQQCLNAFNMKQSYYADLVVDGVIGDNTLNALREYINRRGTTGELVLLKALNCLQGARYIELSQSREANESFVYGWINQRIHI